MPTKRAARPDSTTNTGKTRKQSGPRSRAANGPLPPFDVDIEIDATAVLTRDGKIRYQSPSVEQLLGYRADEVTGRDFVELLHPDDARSATEKLEVVTENPGRTVSMEMRFLHKDGSWRTVESVGTNLLDDPEVNGIIMSYRDVSSRKRLEDQLWLLQNAIENAIAPMAISDIQGNITYVNQACMKLWRRDKKEDLVGGSYWELLELEDPALADEIASTMIESGSWEGEIAARRKDGSTVHVRVLTSILKDKDGKPIQTISSFVDLTDRKRVEQALRESQAQYTALLDNVPDAVFRYQEGVMTWANDRIEQILGYSRDELVGKVADLFVSDDVSLTQVTETVGEGIREQGHFRGTIKAKKKNGTEVDIEFSASNVRGKRPVEIVGVARDITERKKAEEERERLTAELAEKNAEQEQIIYVTSHDLRSPLVNVQGFSKELKYSVEEVGTILSSEEVPQSIRDQVVPILDQDVPDALAYIATSVSKMDTLLTGLLRLSRLGRAALSFEKLNMNLMLFDIAKYFELRIRELGATIDVGTLPPCTGDFVQTNQVFSNLVDNALKYSDPSRPPVIKVTGEVVDEEVVYCVADNGTGIAREHQKKVFEIFHRLNPEASGGEGLGLSIVKKVIGRHSGRIWLESEPGEGSKFYVSLPAAD